MIRANKHKIYNIKQNKVALNEDDKEKLKNIYKYDTLNHGHQCIILE